MDGSRKNIGASLTSPVWLEPSEPGSGCYVVFRLTSDVSFFTSSAGSYASIPDAIGFGYSKSERIAVCRGNNQVQGGGGTQHVGGMAILISRRYNIELPEGVVPSVARNSYVVYNGYGLPSGTTLESAIEEDQPMTQPNVPR